MKPATFARQWAIIEHASGRNPAWRKRALAHLIEDADAKPVMSGSRVVAYRLPDGRTICVKHRYPSENIAIDNIEQITRETDGRIKPVRAYPCYSCMGWHITSEATK